MTRAFWSSLTRTLHDGKTNRKRSYWMITDGRWRAHTLHLGDAVDITHKRVYVFGLIWTPLCSVVVTYRPSFTVPPRRVESW